MKQLVIMPGGFHPFHAGHAALYQSAVEAFPGADVYVAATNDTSTRPFPFPVKEKLAQLAGVAPNRFVQVKSPFRAEEIVHKFDPNNTQLIFVRSEKDAGSQPRPGGTKKDGTPSYLQPYDDASDQPLSQRAYMAYLPTVEFGPGMTSATEIRGAWPKLNEKRKTALVMSLYPKTQTNPKLAATVVKLLDTAMGVVDESALDNLPRPNKRNQFKSIHKQRKQRGLDEVDAQNFVGGMTAGYQRRENQPVAEGPFVQRIMHPGKVNIYVRSGKVPKLVATDIPYEILDRYIAKVIAKYPQFKPSDFSFKSSDKVSENQGWAATYENTAIGTELDEDITRRGFLKGAGAAAITGLSTPPTAGGQFVPKKDIDATNSRNFWNIKQAEFQQKSAEILEKLISVSGQWKQKIANVKMLTTLGEFQNIGGARVINGQPYVMLETTVLFDAPYSTLAWIIGHELGHHAYAHTKDARENENDADAFGAWLCQQLGINQASFYKFLYGKKVEFLRDTDPNSIYPQPAERANQLKKSLGFELSKAPAYIDSLMAHLAENQGWAATYENTAPNPRVDLTPNYPNYATLVGEFIGIKKNRALFRIISAELKPGQGETEKIFRAMTTNTPIGIEIGKVKNRAVLEALKPDAFAALQQAKQNIEQNRQQEVDQWEQDFRANSAKLAGQQLKQRFAEPPPEPPTMPVVQPGESPAALRDRLAQLNIAKQKFEEINVLIKAIKKKYQHSAIEAEINAIERRLETGLLPDVRAGVADNYKSLLAKLDNLKTSLTTRFIVKEAPDYIDEANK